MIFFASGLIHIVSPLTKGNWFYISSCDSQRQSSNRLCHIPKPI